MADNNETETATPEAPSGVLDNAVQKVKDQRDETVAYKLTSEKPLPGARKEVVFEVANEEFQTRLTKVFKDVKNNAAIEGFRRGKAPMALLQRRYQQEASTQVVEEMATQVIRQYIDETKTTTWGSPTISNFTTEKDKPVEVTVVLEVNPDIDITEYTGIDVSIAAIPVKDEYIDARIKDLVEKNATFEPTEDAVSATSEATVSFKVVDKKGNTVESENDFVVSPEEIANGPFAVLVGKKASDTFDFKDGKNTVNGEIKVVRKLALPEVNDDFAADLGVKNLDELKTRERSRIEEQVKEILDNNAFDAILQKLVESNDFEVPPTLQEQTRRDIARSDYTHYQRTGMLPQRLSSLDTRDQYLEEVNKAAHSRVKSYLLMQAIAKKENLEATEEDINTELERLANEQGRKPLGVRAALERQKQWDDFTEQVRLNKIRAFLLGKNKVTYTDPVEDTDQEANNDSEPKPESKAKPAAKSKKSVAKEHAEQEEKPANEQPQV